MGELLDRVSNATRSLREYAREVDWDFWGLIVIFLALFALIMPWKPFLSTISFGWASEPASSFAAYEKALRLAAIKTPTDSKTLRTIDTPEVQLVSFRNTPLRTGRQVLDRDIWTTLPGELREVCKGVENPLLRLQQALGLPVRSGAHVIYRIKVSTQYVTRPCMSGDGPRSSTCGFDPPSDPTGQKKAPGRDEDGDALQNAYRHLRFIADQMWSTYRIGFETSWAAKGDYPYSGYPFTGMGRTFDWGPQPVADGGVTEFIIPKGTEVFIDEPTKTAVFCNERPSE